MEEKFHQAHWPLPSYCRNILRTLYIFSNVVKVAYIIYVIINMGEKFTDKPFHQQELVAKLVKFSPGKNF